MNYDTAINAAAAHDQAELDTLTQAELEGLVTQSDLSAAVGWQSREEKDAAVGSRSAMEYVAVHVDDIDGLRTDGGRRFKGKEWLTVTTAREILPPTYAPREIEGQGYPALHRIPTRTVRGFTQDEVKAMRQRLIEYRERLESERLERVADRKSKFERWLAGDAKITLRIFDADEERRLDAEAERRPINVAAAA